MRNLLILFTLLCLSLPLFAQSYLGFGDKKNDSNLLGSTGNVSPGNILSPEQFKSQVKQLHQKTQEGLSKEVAQQYSKTPPLAPMPTVTPSPMDSTPTRVPQGLNTTPGMSPPPPGNMPATPLSNNPSPAPMQQPIATPAAPTQTEVYTGFQGQQPNPQPPSGSSQDAGWNIKY